MSNFTWVHEHLQGTAKLSPTLSPLTKELGIMLPSHRREGAGEHVAKAKSSPKRHYMGSIMCEQHERTSETGHHSATREREREMHFYTLTSPTSPQRAGGVLENTIRRQHLKCAKGGKINRGAIPVLG